MSSSSRAERLAALLVGAGARPAPGRRPRAPGRLRSRLDLEPALADGVQRHQRPGDRGRRGSAVLDRLPLPGARPARGGGGVRTRHGGARVARRRRERLRGRVGYDDAQTSVKSLRKLEQLVPEGVELVAAGGLVERLRRRKDAGELRAIAEAARLADEVYGSIFDRGVVGRTEREIMLDAHQRMRELGADDPSFPAIVAAGENSALPHHTSSEREVSRRRAVADRHGRDRRRLLLRLHAHGRRRRDRRRGARGLRAGALGPGDRRWRRSERAWMRAMPTPPPAIQSPRAGHGEHFGHGLGHGVGLEVHEAPRVSQRSDRGARGR